MPDFKGIFRRCIDHMRNNGAVYSSAFSAVAALLSVWIAYQVKGMGETAFRQEIKPVLVLDGWTYHWQQDGGFVEAKNLSNHGFGPAFNIYTLSKSFSDQIVIKGDFPVVGAMEPLAIIPKGETAEVGLFVAVPWDSSMREKRSVRVEAIIGFEDLEGNGYETHQIIALSPTGGNMLGGLGSPVQGLQLGPRYTLDIPPNKLLSYGSVKN